MSEPVSFLKGDLVVIRLPDGSEEIVRVTAVDGASKAWTESFTCESVIRWKP